MANSIRRYLISIVNRVTRSRLGSRTCGLIIFLQCHVLANAQSPSAEYPLDQGCYVRYLYDHAGSRTDRYWYCWNDNPNRAMSASDLASNSLRATPNPADESLTVTTETEVKQAVLELLDKTGQLLESKTWNGVSARIEVDTYPAGAYFVRLVSQNESLVLPILVAH